MALDARVGVYVVEKWKGHSRPGTGHRPLSGTVRTVPGAQWGWKHVWEGGLEGHSQELWLHTQVTGPQQGFEA